jgi:hypothetical protein
MLASDDEKWQKDNVQQHLQQDCSAVFDFGLTLFAGDCYSRRVPFGRGFLYNVRQLGLSKRTRQGELTTTKRLPQQSAKQARIPRTECEVQ